MSIIQKHIPRQRLGSETGATAKRELPSREMAISLFNAATFRLLDINKWHEVSGNRGAEFQLTDNTGQALNKPFPETGNLIKISLPAPPNAMGRGYDWVRIERIEAEKNILSDEELHGFRVRPVKKPGEQDPESAHFYTNDATSSFFVYRKANTVYALERGRNEVPNPSGSLLNKIRNIIVALSAMLGLSKPQWKALVDGILNGIKQNN